jgi:hypothetical protein
MDSNKLSMLELQRLLSHVSEHGSQHLQDAEDDLDQTLFLLAQAIQTLSKGFMQINQLVNTQQNLLDQVLAALRITAETTDEFVVLREKIHAEINTVVTGLQFQDLTTQLITRSIKRISGLRELLNVLASHPVNIGDAQNASVEALLETMHDSLSARSGALKDGLTQEVKQKHMVSGDIELF